jgi:OOP family OmpA-OmpF porin
MAKKTFKPLSIMGMAAPLALVAGLSLSPQTWAGGDKDYVLAHKDSVKNSAGECWKSLGTPTLREDCGDKIAKEEVKEEPGPCKDSDGDGVCDDDDKCPDTRPGAKVDANGCEIIADLTIDETVPHFDFDKATLKPAMKTELSTLAGRIKESPGDEHLKIIGNTDSVGSDAYNMKLGQRRADAVKGYLVTEGIAADHMTTSSNGESQPVDTNNTKEGRSHNRRVEIKTN